MTTRIALFVAALAGLLQATDAFADVPVAPPPREIRPDGSRDPVPEPKAEDPAVTVGRIIQNSKAVGERLAMTDPGEETQKKQATILKDIDSLLNRQQQSQSGGGADQKDKKNQEKNSEKQKEKQPSDAKANSEPKTGMEPMPGMPPPKNDDQQQASGRRPRMGEPGAKQPKDQQANAGKKPNDPGMKEPMAKAGMEPMKEPDPTPGGMNTKQPNDPKDKDAKAVNPTGGVPTSPPAARSSLPLDEEVAKKVWGGPRDQMRKQVDQYYTDRFMPGYSTLLKGYYAHLATSGMKK
jgi:hypothetical protein